MSIGTTSHPARELPASFAYLETDVPPGMTLAAWRRERAPPPRPRRRIRRLLRRAWRGTRSKPNLKEDLTMNTIQLVGRLTKDPEPDTTTGGKPVCDMRLAVPRRDRDADPVYVDVIAYDALAQTCAAHLEKGRQVAVSGRLDYQEWEARDGSGRRSRHQVVAGEVEFLARPATDTAAAEAPAVEPSAV